MNWFAQRLRSKPIVAASIFAVLTLILWHWQAAYADHLRIIRVPKWVAGGGNVTYSIAVGKSQIKPYGTVWKRTVGASHEENFPIYNAEDVERYLARRK